MTTSTLIKIFAAMFAIAAIACFTSNTSGENNSALGQQTRKRLSSRASPPAPKGAKAAPLQKEQALADKEILAGLHRELGSSLGSGHAPVPTPAPPSPPNAGGPGQNGLVFPQGFALDDPFVTAPEVAAISLAQLRARFAAFFGN